jgi:hypothetical protein
VRRRLRIGGIATSALAAASAAAAVLGARAWERATARAVGRLGEGAAGTADENTPARFARDELIGLPAPAARYFGFALTPGQPLVRHARLLQAGLFARSRDRWAPFTAVEDVTVRPPGFVWDARIRMAPLLTARVRDSYLAGQGAVRGTLGGLVTLVDTRGTPETAAASLQRYLAEAPWFPTALLPSAGIVWTPIDRRTARATLADHGVSVWIDFHFGAQGEIVATSAERYRDVDGTTVLTPWEGEFSDYERLDGMMVPRRGRVAWVLPDGPFTYWRGRIVEAEYQFPPSP